MTYFAGAAAIVKLIGVVGRRRVTYMRGMAGRSRWAIPAGVVTVTGVVIAAAAVANAEAAPTLPHRTAEQLLTAVAQGAGKPVGPFTATVQETSQLGLPSLPSAGSPSGGPSALTSGTNTVSIWYRNPQHLRLAVPVQAGETDLRLNGRTMWTWSSRTQTATRYVLPATVSGLPKPGGNAPVPGKGPASSPAAGANALPATPQAAAAEVLKAVGPTTIVGVQRNIYVAGHAAYQLSLAPRSSKSLVGRVVIAIDASRHVALSVQVFPRGSSAAAYGVSFTALRFGAPAASNFSFTPPPGAHVKKVSVPSSLPAALKQAGLPAGGLAGLGSAAAVAGQPSVAPLTSGGKLPRLPAKVLAKIKARFAASLPKSIPAAQRARIIRQFDRQLTKGPAAAALRVAPSGSKALKVAGNNGGGWWSGYAPLSAAGAPPGGAKVIGTSWLSVVATPPSPQIASAMQRLLATPSPQARTSATYSGGSGSQAYSSALTIATPAGPYTAALHALLMASTPEHGYWGRGRLLQTRLLSVLITSKGQILAGAVKPSVLYADVARDAG